ncbi:maleylpyruvate isomerase N-terminal domain-containing protein [Williamsia sp. CHRR-6]|uniref:maleylpyruvate isomerase N-terminal domain-containing protein n=1 Tax=Williamsia sp. CHRR-6 TaxID=2835871 RepID=UPI001BDA0114|nr:maleylpyruvate isomerase N-terminal domain-containing protein [Williamsia sp. CHRR-6]MBT0566036.1 maleylpyruvate isomerase family mycothiol-dependent enzyme [Williamsia sp. CHRR-6]
MSDREQTLRWVAEGTLLWARALDAIDDAALSGRSGLPGWSRAHLVAHVAANARALRNLVHWAATGEQTPMYASSQQRADDIEAGSRLPAAELRDRWASEATALDADLAALDDTAWGATVRTAQGRDLPATEIPWLRAREVMVHAADLASTMSFADLPVEFLRALEVDIRARRGPIPEVTGALEDRVAWLAGRRHHGVTRNGVEVGPLAPWL